MKPGEKRTLRYTGRRSPTGFKHSGNIPGLLNQGGGVFGNGTFVNSGALAPYVGYNAGNTLTDRNQRWREGLDPVPRYADLDDETAWGNSYLTQDADWVTFKATVSTSADQVAIAPGYLVDESVSGDRRIFHYEMDAPMQNFYAVLSARYASRVENWKGIELSVFYYPEHEWNVDRILTSLKKSLDYFGKNFSPYQYRQMRVLEFPAYATFAQSFPNTIPWSEGIGFIADVTDPEEIDYVFYVGAHEVAHQWWGHQVSSANVQGQTVLVETLAQYSALMVMEEEYGPHMMRRFLKYELDNYLQNRGGEAIEELPLYRVENQQYIHYRKGSVVMYALKDALGVDAMNRAMQGLIRDAAYQYNPYPTSRDLIRNIRAQATTDEQQALITDLFEKITLWDLKVDEVTVAERSDGKFDVTINVEATKYYADGQGQQEETPLDMLLDIGVFSENLDDVTEGDEHVLYFAKHRIQSGASTITVTVDEKPQYAGIDPYNKLIDRNSDDNIEAADEID
jgi:aminopeptidase N